ncbi:hypothetical protein C8R44DRAFT_141159 [Mycena epipterygia]|nr:hypothetical protein C8R44DRAFT_141159 [Mycena epipterygia]
MITLACAVQRHHLLKTGASFVGSRPSPGSFCPPYSTQPRSSAYKPLPGSGDRHHRHPGQRYTPPDPVAQSAAWSAQQLELRERKMFKQKLMWSFPFALGTLMGLGWFMGKY